MTTTDPLAALRAGFAAKLQPQSPQKPAASPQTAVQKPAAAVVSPAVSKPPAAPGSAPPPAQKVQAVETVPITGEHVFQRLHYFESLAKHLLTHNVALRAQVQRTGTAPIQTYFAPLKSLAGDFDPNSP